MANTVEYARLFKALPVNKRSDVLSTKYLSQGFLIEQSVLDEYPDYEIRELLRVLVPSGSDMGKTFHKSWKKVAEAPMGQLILEQVFHYFSTYGLRSLGVKDDRFMWIPDEKFDLDEIGGITFFVLKGMSYEDLKEKILTLLGSGMALSETDVMTIGRIIRDRKMVGDIDLSQCMNREVKVMLYELTNTVPKDPVEFLRLVIWEKTRTTLLIKNKMLIDLLKAAPSKGVFEPYERLHGIAGLASVFYRFKPIFLALKKGNEWSVNRIRKAAKKYHKPMPEDVLGSITKNMRHGGKLDLDAITKALERAPVFRKIKLVQALKFYGNANLSGVVHTIRNGKAWIRNGTPIPGVWPVVNMVYSSLAKDLEHLKGKKVYMDAEYAVPTSGKMFCGDVPFGSSFKTGEALAMGVTWTGAGTDLDLSVVSLTGKTGWDAGYRNDSFLFSGDITSAPNGATEVLLARNNIEDGIYLLNLNLYHSYINYGDEIPFTMFVTKEDEYRRHNMNSLLSKDNMLFYADSTITREKRQKTIGVLKVSGGRKAFYIYEGKTGGGRTYRGDLDRIKQTIGFYNTYLDSIVTFKNFLHGVGTEFVDSPEEADIDLSLASVTKDKFIEVLTKK